MLMKIPTLFKEYVWLVNTIYKAREITFAEINKRWVQTEMSEGIAFSRTTFHRHRIAIEEIFGLLIDCDKKNGNKYYIGNEYVLREDSVQNWMVSTLSVSNLLGENQSIHNRILLENVPSGNERYFSIYVDDLSFKGFGGSIADNHIFFNKTAQEQRTINSQ